jgi:hypothetical protein
MVDDFSVVVVSCAGTVLEVVVVSLSGRLLDVGVNVVVVS